MTKNIILTMITLSTASYAQSIEGKITTNKKAITDAEVVISKDSEKFFSVSDTDGYYNLTTKENGEYLLEIFQNGQSIFSEKVNIQGKLQKNIDLTTQLIESQVEAVTVLGRKKLIERKVDRLIFNVENSIAAQGLDALEALSKTPMLRTSENTISIAGKSNVAVMINDKLVNLSGDDLINYLKTFRSDDIARIEVITTPPAQYEAEGKSGLVNIIFKKNTSLGWNATLQTSGSYYFGKPIIGSKSGATFNYQGKKLSVTTNISTGRNYWAQRTYIYNQYTDIPDYWNTDSKSMNNISFYGGNIKTEYKINDKNQIGFSYHYTKNKSHEQADSKTKILDNNNLTSFESNANNRNHRNIHNATIFYDIKLDSIGGKLSFSGNYMSNGSNANNYYNTITDATLSTNVKPSNRYKIYSGQFDFAKTIKKVKTEFGAKLTQFENSSFFNFYNLIDAKPVFNTIRSNDFIYNEENYAAYLSGAYDFNEKWKAKLGLRYEFTHLKGFSPTENLTNESDYGKLFPTVYLSYQPNENHSYTINYSRRIGRPLFGELNPFRYFTSEFEYSSGNPYLRPTFTDNFEIGYVFKNNLNITTYYNRTIDNYDRVQRFNDGIKYSTTENFYNSDRAGINISYNFNKIKWFETNIFANAFYSASKSFIKESIANLNGYGADYYIDNTIFLTKDKTWNWFFGYWQDLPYKDGNTRYKNIGVLYTGLKGSFLNNNLVLNFHLNDILNTSRSKGTEYYSDFHSNYYYKGYSRILNFSATYKFGNSKVSGATKELQFDDAKRAGG